MRIIAKTKHTELSYLLKKNYEQLYAKLSQVLEYEELAFFAKVQFTGSESIWQTYRSRSWFSFSQASKTDQDLASDIIRELQQSIRYKLEQDSELEQMQDQLMDVPSEEQILLFRDEMGNLQVTIYQWACKAHKSRGGVNPIGKIVNRPKSDHTPVTVQITYTDGLKAAGDSFEFHYKDQVKPFVTNDEGLKPLGPLKNSSGFAISFMPTGESAKQALTVIPGQTLYEVVIPIYTQVTVKVINQLGEPVNNCPLDLAYSNATTSRNTDEDGTITLDNVQVDQQPFKVASSSSPDNTKQFQVRREGNLFVYELKERIIRQPRLLIVDQEGEPVANYGVNIRVDEELTPYQSSEGGIVLLNEFDIDQSFEVIDDLNKYNYKEYTVTPVGFEFTFEVKKPELKTITFRLLDEKKSHIPKAQLDIFSGEKEFNKLTDEKGLVTLEAEDFPDKQRVTWQAAFKTKDKKGHETERKTKLKRFKHKAKYFHYDLYLKKFNKRWLWLLLLLLLIPLFLKFDKTIHIQTLMPNQNLVANAEVNFQYSNHHFIRQWRFDDPEPYDSMALSDSNGIASFINLRYTGYSYIFKHFRKAEAFVLTDCYTSDTLRQSFHSIKNNDTLKLILHPTLVDLDFKVVDEEDKEPLPNSLVIIEAEMNGLQVYDSARTNANGTVLFEGIPKCGNIKSVFAEHYGYFPDSIVGNPVKNIMGNADQYRLLELEPIKEKIEFYVVSCTTGEPIPEANATIYFDNLKGNNGIDIPTNVNGVGKGEYEDAHILKLIDIEASHRYFKPGKLKQRHIVEDFIKLPKEDRTICLEPLPLTMEFTNIDSITSLPLPGVTNEVIIYRGGIEVTSTSTSNRNGKFSVTIQAGDKISIRASLRPNYHDNDYTINRRDGINLLEGPATDRIIPLVPKIVTLTFRTVDQIDWSLLSDVELTVLGAVYAPNNSGNGPFPVSAFYGARVEIVASKTEYKTNNHTINGSKTFEYLSTSTQKERDIPLDWSINCGISVDSGDGTSGERFFTLGSTSGMINISYKMYGHPDRMIIYCGKGTTGEVLFDQIIEDVENSPQQRYFDAKKCNGQVTVHIIPTEDDQNSSWMFNISCPSN